MRCFLLGTMAAMLVACSDSTSPSPVATLEASADAVTLGVGDTVRLEAALADPGGVRTGPALRWRSLEPSRVTVDEANGMLVGRDTGDARVVVTADALADTVRVRVTRRVATLALFGDSTFISGAVRIQAVARDRSGVVIPDAAVRFVSTDTLAAPVTTSGIVSGWAEGTTRIRASAGSATAVIDVRISFLRSSFGGRRVRQLALGMDFGCALDEQGIASCFGANFGGRIGRGIPSNDQTYVIGDVVTSERFVEIDAHDATACGRTAAGRLLCWGQNSIPQLSTVPAPVLDSLGTRGFSVGKHAGSCAIGADDVLRCWGHNDAYQLGRGPLAGYLQVPAPVTGSSLRFRDVALGYLHGCGVLTSGQGYCWGGINNIPGMADTVPRDPPAPLPSHPPFTQVVSAGGVFFFLSCGLTAAGEAWCWGDNYRGFLGSGSLAGPAAVRAPQRVAGNHVFTRLDAGYFHVCGITAAGEVWCWGESSAFGHPSDRFVGSPMRFAPGRTFATFATSGYGTCGVPQEGREMLCTFSTPHTGL